MKTAIQFMLTCALLLAGCDEMDEGGSGSAEASKNSIPAYILQDEAIKEVYVDADYLPRHAPLDTAIHTDDTSAKEKLILLLQIDLMSISSRDRGGLGAVVLADRERGQAIGAVLPLEEQENNTVGTILGARTVPASVVAIMDGKTLEAPRFYVPTASLQGAGSGDGQIETKRYLCLYDHDGLRMCYLDRDEVVSLDEKVGGPALSEVFAGAARGRARP